MTKTLRADAIILLTMIVKMNRKNNYLGTETTGNDTLNSSFLLQKLSNQRTAPTERVVSCH